MAIDVKAIDRRIKKLQRFKEFAKEFDGDPEFTELLAEFAIKGKNGSNPEPATDAVSPASESNGSGSSRGPRGHFLQSVLGAIDLLGNKFTSQDVENELRKRKFEFHAAKPNIAINEALRTLEKKRHYIERSGKRNGVQIVWKKTISAVESRTA